jgi:hypothetical protein
MPDVHGAYATGEVDESIAINIFDNGPLRFSGKYIHSCGDAACYGCLATGQ